MDAPEFYERSTTSSGVTVLTERMDSVRSVALGVWVATGSRDERPGEAGVSHFLEHMMFKGTPTRTAFDISEAFDRIGAEVNAFTSKEYTCYYFRAVDTRMADGLAVLSDMFMNSSLAADAVTSEREVVLEEISRRDDTPDDLVHEVLADAMWPGHPVGRAVLGTRDTVAAFEPQDLRDYISRRHLAGNVIIAASGHVEHADVLGAVEKSFSVPEGGGEGRDDAPPPLRQDVAVAVKDTEQSHICVGTPGLHSRHDDRFVLGVIDTVLGGGMSSRLFQEIREKRGLAYAVYSYHGTMVDTGAFVVYAGTRPDNTEQVVGLIREGIDRLVADGITAEELDRARESIRGQVVLSMESTQARMTRLGKSEATKGELLSLDELIERVEAVTLDDVERVARDTLGGQKVLAVVGPLPRERLANLLD